MKLKIVLLVLLLPAASSAAPFLVCDAPPAAEAVTHYVVHMDGNLIESNSTAHSDGALRYDLAGVPPGAHQFNAQACNVWGCSDLPVNPYVSPDQAQSPTVLRMIP